jgi:REP element-mobilizing transposase RayT
MRFIYEDIDVYDGGNLPHWNVVNGLYFVTFRLADSIPLSILAPIQRQRDLDLREAELIVIPEVRARLRKEAQRRYSIAVDAVLDRNLGQCVLADPAAAAIVADSMKYFDAKRYDLFAWSVMPNHAHSVFSLLTATIDEVMHSWKRFSAQEINKIFGQHGSLWQPEYYDVTIRNTNHFDACVKYVLNNPLKAGVSAQFTGFSAEAWQRTGLWTQTPPPRGGAWRGAL